MLKWFALAILFCFTAQYAHSQGIQGKNFVVTQWGMKEGLPQSTVNDIIQSKDGYIWLATFGGVVRFDGNSFTTLSRANTPAMHSDRVISLYEDREGALWINTDFSLIRMMGNEIKSYLISQGALIQSLSQIREDTDNKLWGISSNKVYYYENNVFNEASIYSDPDLVELALNNSGGVWLATRDQILKTIGDSVVVIEQLGDGLINSGFTEIIEYPERSGSFYIGTNNEGIIRYQNGTVTRFDGTNGLPSNNFLKFNKDLKGNLFAILVGSAAVWNGEYFESLKSQLPIKDSGIVIKSILEDNEGNYWVGTNANGLYKLRPAFISMIDQEDGLQNERMLAIAQLKDGSALLSTNCGGIYRWKDDKISLPELDFIAGDGCFWSMLEDSKNRYWFGTRGIYVTNSLSEQGRMLNDTNGFTDAEIFAIKEDSKGNIWIAASDRLIVYDENEESIRNFTTNDGLYFNHARALFEDDDGTMWVGTGFGLNTIKNNKVQKVKLLPTNVTEAGFSEPYVRAIYKDRHGTMWIGTYGNGIFRIKNNQVSNITTEHGLFDNIISHLIEDEFGNFWMGSNKGISQVSIEELNGAADGNINSVKAYSFGVADGMNSAETNGGFQPNTFADSLGRIYFPTVAGVAVVSTRDVQKNEIVPPVYIEHISTNEIEFPISSHITTSYDTPYIDIKYTAINFTDPKKVEFKYRIKGLDENWIEAGGNRSTLISRLPPGEYTFQVIASNSDGVWNNEGASLAISVIPPFWQTNWFYFIITVLFFASGSTVYYLRIKTLERKNEQQKRFTEQLIESQESERRRIASELHDGLGQQILVIKNRAELAKIHANRVTSLHEQLDEILNSAVSSIQSVRTITHGLRPVHLERFGLTQSLENLCDQLQQSTSIDWSYHIDDLDGLIPKNAEINFYRVIQEGTNNIIKHASAGEASVVVNVEGPKIKAVVWDDGKGFDLHQAEISKGLGFLGMKERIEILNGTLRIHSEVGKGTTITIEIPISDYE